MAKENNNKVDSSSNKEGTTKPIRFGRYLILDHLADGGMGKTCRARILDEQANKIVAIKMIRPQYSQDANFKKMFMDEIKVAFGLSHPNIVQTYDYGILNGQLYTALEYVDGKTLKQYLDKLKEMKFVFPVEISTYIISQVCQALSYAHSFTDKLTGKPYNIIHRDISPHNIMLTYDGSVKVIDFGIAKAATNSEETQAGTIKGKISYLAPEYLDGMELDHRYDQFSVGITLWEMLCSRKLFHAENELAILKKIQTCQIPSPCSINPKVPKELEQIVLKSVTKQRDNRYENMDQFNRALVKFLYSHYPDFNATDLNHFAIELFKEDISADRAKLVEFGKIDIAPYLREIKGEVERGKNNKTSNGTNPHLSANSTNDDKNEDKNDDKTEKTAQRRIVIDFENDPEEEDASVSTNKITLDIKKNDLTSKSMTKAARNTTIKANTARGKSTGNNLDNNILPLSNSINAANAANSTNTSPPAVASINKAEERKEDEKGREKEKEKEKKEERNDSTESQQNNTLKVVASFSIAALILGGVYFAFIKKNGPDKESNSIVTNNQEKEKRRDISSIKRNGNGNGNGNGSDNQEQESGTKSNGRLIIFVGANPYQRFYINNDEINYDLTSGVNLPLNKELKLRVEQDRMLPLFVDFQITSDDETTSINLPETQMGIFGMINIMDKYPEGSTLHYQINGHEVVWRLPINNKKIPIGEYTAIIHNPENGTDKKINFTIKEDVITKIQEDDQ